VYRDAIPAAALEICRRLDAHSFGAWVVGGCVRDHLMGRDVSDWDICTSASPQQVMKIFPRVIPTGVQHGTVTVLMAKTGYEVTTLRGETTYSDGRRPDSVYFVDDVQHDLARRDFTVNAIAFDPVRELLIDPFDGIGDLRRRVIRAVGKASERFAEDGLRVLRAARFVATLEFALDEETRKAIGPNIDTFKKVSAERVRDEWVKTLKAREPSRAFAVMHETGILGAVEPAFEQMAETADDGEGSRSVLAHSLAVLDAAPIGDVIVRMAALLHDIGKTQSREQHAEVGAKLADAFLKEYRFSNEERARVTHLVRHHVIDLDALRDGAAVRRFIVRVTPSAMDDLVALRRADLVARGDTASLERLDEVRADVRRTLDAKHPLSTRDLAINGGDLQKELGIPPSKQLGDTLAMLLDRVLDDPALNEREKLLEIARGRVSP
jgi:tRNA nucleotidyltransferase (CCA-adding enzyme)